MMHLTQAFQILTHFASAFKISQNRRERKEIICFPWQALRLCENNRVPFWKNYLAPTIRHSADKRHSQPAEIDLAHLNQNPLANGT